jgi:hypothetical protein
MVKVKEDLTGQKFGRLTVMYQTDDYVTPQGIHYAVWHCVCDCDEHNEVDVLGTNLKRGHSQSCGCRKEELTIERSRKYNEYKIENNIVYIKLSNCDEYTMVNLDKWNEISYIREFCWHKDTHNYVSSNIPKKLRQQFGKRYIGLHQLVCPCKKGFEPDHLDRNPLNNLTENLMPKTHQDNMYNKGLYANNKSGCTGIYWSKKENRWKANICLGTFDDINEAIKVYNDVKNYYNQYYINSTNKQNNIKEENNEQEN